MIAPADRILVVTPTLGTSRFLDGLVASVAAQTANIQHVLAAPADKVAELRARFPQVQVCIDAGTAGGLYGALNAGLAAAHEPWGWFTYINDDDALLPGFSALPDRATAADPVPDVAYGDVELIDESGERVSLITTERRPAWIPALLQQGISPLIQQGMIFRRPVVETLQAFDTRYRLCADLDFWLRAYAAGARFQSHPLRVAQFRIRRGQLSGNTALTEMEQSEIVGRHLPRPVTPAVRRFARFRYRWCNLPRYVARVWSRGFQTSYDLLGSGEAHR